MNNYLITKVALQRIDSSFITFTLMQSSETISTSSYGKLKLIKISNYNAKGNSIILFTMKMAVRV